jgi:hypothetical protein
MAKNAYGYIRGRRHSKKWAPDRKHQRRQIEDYADANGYDLIEVFIEEAKFSLAGKTGAYVLASTLKRCTADKADLLYIDLGRWRRNPVFASFVAASKIEKPGRRYPYKFVGIPAERATLEAVERQARLEKYEESFRIKKIKNRADAKPTTPLQQWKHDNEIGTKRFKNFRHLYAGMTPIYQSIEDNDGKSMREIADLLNKEIYLTVDGKRWNRHNVRKTIDLIATDEFQEFVTLCNEARKDL